MDTKIYDTIFQLLTRSTLTFPEQRECMKLLGDTEHSALIDVQRVLEQNPDDAYRMLCVYSAQEYAIRVGDKRLWKKIIGYGLREQVVGNHAD